MCATSVTRPLGRVSLALALCGLNCLARAQQTTAIQLRDVSASTGITFEHCDGSSGRRYIVEYVASGLAVFDYDQDGDDDIYFLSGAALPGSELAQPPRNALYRNDGQWQFTDVTDAAGVGDTGFGLGVVAADYDNDGDCDLYVNNYGPNVCYRNNGDGTFSDVTEELDLQCGSKVGAGVCFLDLEADGDLDLYVANYIKFSPANHTPHMYRGVPVYRSPLDYEPEPDQLFRNNGDGSFTDVSAESQIGSFARNGMGMTCADYDDDGDTDIFVGNDCQENLLFQNRGDGVFDEVALFNGVACDLGGVPQGTMGIECADYDNDGKLDFYATAYNMEFATLYRNLGGGVFEDVTRLTKAGTATFADVTWGSGLIDFDHDGDRDLFVACGNLDDNAQQKDDRLAYETLNRLLLNTGRGTFEDVTALSGDGLQVRRSSRAAGFSDFDGDGDMDTVIQNIRCQPTLLRNDSSSANHWIQIQLRGVRSNREGVGAQRRRHHRWCDPSGRSPRRARIPIALR